ncbi:MAG: ATP-binding cassette domain-containing protein [bacterium]|nr:ATP-binding cassette domain-containing protein [bacterium]
MAQVNVSGLTFCYEGSFDNIFENVSFSIDTDWKLGLIGRNGKGKTTFLNLLLGKYEYRGSITTSTVFEYFPYPVEEAWMTDNTIDVIERLEPEYELWKICRELDLLHTDAELLYRPYHTLSHGERTKVMLALLFSGEQAFLLIDEPTNHLDMPTRKLLVEYLKSKKGFILVSHDRWFLDQCVDHVLVLNRNTITVEKGNFSTWWENKQKKDAFELAENEKLKHEIAKLDEAAKKNAMWADKVEATKIGFDPVKEHDRFLDTRAYIGARSKKMQKRSKTFASRSEAAIQEKQGLLKDLESPVELKLMPLTHHKEIYIACRDYSCGYATFGNHVDQDQCDVRDDVKDSSSGAYVIKNLTMQLKRGDRMILQGANGCGKSTLIKSILQNQNVTVLNHVGKQTECSKAEESFVKEGSLEAASGLLISYINQDTSFLKGSLEDYIRACGVEESLFKAILRQLDFERVQFEKTMEDYSEGQRKKVLIAGSLLQQAHLYIWDEPLNYIDVFSRMQIEQLILKYQPTMLIVEHDQTFADHIATQKIFL